MLRKIHPQVTALFLLLVLPMSVGSVLAQRSTDKILRDRIAANRQKIESAASWHATEEQLGGLWLQLAYDYQDEVDIPHAEEAYSHSLTLLRARPRQKPYAIALDGLASLYLTTGRVKESETCQRKALAIFEALGDQAGIARIHVDMAIALLDERRWAESEAESEKALKSLRGQSEPNQSDFVAGLISSSYAKCFQERCKEGLITAREAVAAASVAFARDSLEGVSAVMALGFEQWKNGAEAEGEKTMWDALELMRQQKTMPQSKQVDAELRVLVSYTSYLKATHQKGKAKEMENEISRLKGEQTPFCKDCTVDAVALANVR
jgi:tetratricopeptide (TPR) repeat protein